MPCRILNRRLLKFVFSIDLLDFFHRLLNRSDGLHSLGRGDQLLPAAGANPLGGDLLRGFDIIHHSAVSRDGPFCGLLTGLGLYHRHECFRCLPRS